MDLSKYGIEKEDKYQLVKGDDPMFQRKGEYDHWGFRFRCPSCGSTRYLLGRDAYEWSIRQDRVGCKACGQWRVELKNRMPFRQAIHFNNMKRR